MSDLETSVKSRRIERVKRATSIPLLIMIAMLLLTPFVVYKPASMRSGFGVPQVYGGDEPHYLVILNSILEDGDLEVGNNYTEARSGGLQAGYGSAGRPLLHHTTWFDNDGKRSNGFIYLEPPVGPLTQADNPVIFSPQFHQPQYSTHPPGSALFMALFVFPFRGTRYVEACAVILSSLLIIVSLLFFRATLLSLGTGIRLADFISFVGFFCTPVWHYARTVYSENWLLMFVMIACYLGVTRRPIWVVGIVVALGVLIKPPFALIVLPFIPFAWPAEKRNTLTVLLPIVLGCLVMAALNTHMFGAPWRSAQDFTFGNPIIGLQGLLFSWNKGLITLSPVLAIAAVLWVQLLTGNNSGARGPFAARKAEYKLLLSVFLTYVCVISFWSAWGGGWCYGPRLILPVIPLAAISLTMLSSVASRKNISGFILVFCVALSFIVQLLSVARYWQCLSRNPLDIVTTFIQLRHK